DTREELGAALLDADGGKERDRDDDGGPGDAAGGGAPATRGDESPPQRPAPGERCRGAGGLPPPRGPPAHGPELDGNASARRARARELGLLAELLAHDHHRRALEGTRSRHELVKDAAERVEIAARVDRLAGDLFGRHVLRRTEHSEALLALLGARG